jgi:hypothetical protein
MEKPIGTPPAAPTPDIDIEGKDLQEARRESMSKTMAQLQHLATGIGMVVGQQYSQLHDGMKERQQKEDAQWTEVVLRTQLPLLTKQDTIDDWDVEAVFLEGKRLTTDGVSRNIPLKWSEAKSIRVMPNKRIYLMAEHELPDGRIVHLQFPKDGPSEGGTIVPLTKDLIEKTEETAWRMGLRPQRMEK